MAHWEVRVGLNVVYRGGERPKDHPDGRLELPNGQTFAKGTFTMVERQGDPPVTSRASLARSSKKPQRKNPAGGRGESNT
jgi:hypothetical protein